MHCTELKRTILFRADIPATGVSYIRESYTKKAISYSVFDLSLSRLIQFMHKLCKFTSRTKQTVRLEFESASAESANTRPLSFSNCAATDECIMTTGSWTWAYSDNDAWRYDDDRMQYTSTHQSWCSIMLPRSVSHSLHVHSLRRLWCDLFVRHWTHSLCAVDTTLFS